MRNPRWRMTLERAEPGRLAPLACRAGGTAARRAGPARAALAESIAAALLATQPAPQPVLPWRWRLGLVGAVLSVGLLGYAWKGSMAGWHPAPPPNPAEAMVQRLADRIAAAPDSAQPAEWAMLGRSLTVLGRQAEAIAAYRQALARLEQGSGAGGGGLARGPGRPAGQRKVRVTGRGTRRTCGPGAGAG